MKLLIGVAAALLIVLSIAMAVPQVRAAVLEFLQIGAIRFDINEGQPGAALATQGPVATPVGQVRRPDELFAETSLDQAAALVNFPIRLPTYPPDLGLPDRVYSQELADPAGDGQVLILDWLVPGRPDESQLSLYQIGAPYYGVKEALRESLQETRVLNHFAVWVPAGHRLQVQGEEGLESIVVGRDVLIWTDEVMTYRLESDLFMEEAVRVAESLEIYAEE